MMSAEDKKSFKAYLVASRDGVSRFEYVYMLREDLGIHDDFLAGVVALFDPEIIEYECGLFIGENFTSRRYEKSLQNGTEPSEVSYWLNMVELTSFLGDVSYEYAVKVGEVVRCCWASKLEKTYPDSGFEARLLREEELGEVWVTLCKR